MHGVSECDKGTSQRRPGRTGGLSNQEEKYYLLTCLHLSCIHSTVVVVAVFCLVRAKHKFDLCLL